MYASDTKITKNFSFVSSDVYLQRCICNNKHICKCLRHCYTTENLKKVNKGLKYMRIIITTKYAYEK